MKTQPHKTNGFAPLPYPQALADHLATHEREAWKWLSKDMMDSAHANRVHLELLKTTYRIERETKPDLYALADGVKAVLGLDTSITFYQMQQSDASGMNAILIYLPGEANVAFQGPILDRLNEAELKAVIGHELGHFMLLEKWSHTFRIAAEVLDALVHDPSAQAVHAESYRLFHLYNEVFCDRCALAACEDLHTAIATLVKVETGLDAVDAESYLRQTEEICAQGPVKTEGLRHPETYLRAWALKMWVDQSEDVEQKVCAFIEGPPSLEGMDLLGQQQAMALTRTLMEALLWEPWIQSDAVRAHAKLFFDDFSMPTRVPTEDELLALREITDEKLCQYFCYILLDFVACDRDLEEPSLAAALLLSRKIEIEQHFRKVACKELKLRKTQFDQLETEAEKILEIARASGAKS